MSAILSDPATLNAIILIIGTVISAIAGLAHRKSGKLIDARVQNETLASTLLWLNDVVRTVVLELAQTIAEEIRTMAADGKIDSMERDRLRQLALERTMKILGDAGVEKARAILGLDLRSFMDFLLSKVEAKVFEIKLPHLPTPAERQASQVTA